MHGFTLRCVWYREREGGGEDGKEVFINCGIYDFPLSCFGDRREGQGLSVRTYSFILSCVQGGVEGAARWGGGGV